MKFLSLLHSTMNEQEDLTRLPEEAINEIRRNVRKGASDLSLKWANALELVHKAYEVSGVQRPTPGMKEAWKQYEENIQYAVEQLAKHRGMKADWRMSSSLLRDAAEVKSKYKITIFESVPTAVFTEANGINQIINLIGKASKPFEMKVKRTTNEATISFYKWGIKRNMRVVIEKVIS